MASASQSLVNNQSLFEEQELMVSAQIGVFPFPFHTNFDSLKTLSPNTPPNYHHFSSLLAADSSSPLTNLSDQSIVTRKNEDLISSNHHYLPGVPKILSTLQRSASDYWAWGEVSSDCMSMKTSVGDDRHLGISAMKMKKIKGRRKVREPRFCFKTMSDVDVLDDGYKWRKYGQKVVKNTQHPRSYYRCTQDNCRVKKRVERLADDPRMVITTYEGRHIHSPSHDVDDSQASAQLNNFFW